MLMLPKQYTNARHQLLNTKRLGNIIICASIQKLHFFFFICPHRQHCT